MLYMPFQRKKYLRAAGATRELRLGIRIADIVEAVQHVPSNKNILAEAMTRRKRACKQNSRVLKARSWEK